jgi:hypothetical protein
MVGCSVPIATIPAHWLWCYTDGVNLWRFY